MNTKDAKIRVIAISNDEDTKENLDAAAKKKIEEWQKKFKDDISKQKDAKQIEFDEIAHQAKQPEEISLKLEKNMMVHKSETYLQKHLYATEDGCPYVTEQGKFFDSSWEEKIVKSELENQSLEGWYRNGRGGSSSIVVPYEEDDEWKTMCPDLFFVHKEDKKLVVDLYDPHSPNLADTSPKWVGLAKYAKNHGDAYRSVNAVIEENGKLMCLDLKAEGIIDLLKAATNETAIRKLFKEKGKKCST